MSVVLLRRGVGRFGTGRVAAELSCELSGAGTARRHFIAELTDYIVIVGRGLPSTYRQRYVEYYCL